MKKITSIIILFLISFIAFSRDFTEVLYPGESSTLEVEMPTPQPWDDFTYEWNIVDCLTPFLIEYFTDPKKIEIHMEAWDYPGFYDYYFECKIYNNGVLYDVHTFDGGGYITGAPIPALWRITVVHDNRIVFE